MPIRIIALVAAALAWPAMAQPAFDCAGAEGQVERLICADAALAGRDRALDAVYRAAMAKARDGQAALLRAEQRGWIKGRNECWKAQRVPTWLTASWTADTMPGCIEANYRLRTAELQAVWRLVPPRTVFHVCDRNPANEVVANHFATDPPTMRLERGDRTVTLWRVPAAGDGVYEGQNVSVTAQGDRLQVKWLDVVTGRTEDLACGPR